MDAYTLGDGKGTDIVVWTYGATLVEVRVPDRDGHSDNVAHRLPTLADYADRDTNAYVGATVGRFCRNVAHGTITLDGVRHTLDRNAGPHHLHGGTHGFDRLVWREAGTERTEDHVTLTLALDSPDGDQGYPGDLHVETVYRLDRETTLTVAFRATTTAPTVVGLTNHTFWNLAGAGAGTGRTADRHHLAVNATRALRFDGDQVPLPGPPSPVTGTPLHLTGADPLGELRVDNFYVLDDPRSWAADLHDPASGRHLRLSTDQSGMGVYTGDALHPPRAGVCLQPSAWPDAPNRPDFPSARLDPGETYTATTRYVFSVR
ncbi:aldose epimerase family protein [Streptomyces sp. URMC 123]|uniref:aldose epimerase family protein n=1 Tax=Streptomyces sp. URMC 123 TaxID=3423403 RepID=UPI003F1DBB7C